MRHMFWRINDVIIHANLTIKIFVFVERAESKLFHIKFLFWFTWSNLSFTTFGCVALLALFLNCFFLVCLDLKFNPKNLSKGIPDTLLSYLGGSRIEF